MSLKIACIGGGPAGLYFSLLVKKARPDADITVYERNRRGETFGWGVVFSDETLGYLEENDAETHAEITRTFAHWNSIDVHYRGQVLTSTGHGFSGIARRRLLEILQERCESLGVKLVFEREIDDVAAFADHDLVFAADGVRSRVRSQLEHVFQPSLDVRKSKYIWLGTHRLFDAFTFLFEENEHGLFQVHAYRFDANTSTFIVECDEQSWRNAGLDRMAASDGAAYLEKVFARHLQGQRLLLNNSNWINFVTVRNRTWRHGNVVLAGDAAHTAHFSIGSGTKLAMEDAIALAKALQVHASVPAALEAYEAERRPVVERTQKAAQDSLLWFENSKRYVGLAPEQFAFSLMARSKKLGYDNLKLRDPAFVENVTRWFARGAGVRTEPPPPPMFTPFRLRDMQLVNRVAVSPMCMYSAEDGTPNDFHLVHLGARAMGGAGLVVTEMTDVSAEGRITPGCTGMYLPEHVTAWKRIVDFVHGHSKAKLALQLGHAGRKGATKRMWEGMDEPLEQGGWELLAPSPIPYKEGSATPREMTRADMDLVREQFTRAARMAAQAGFDMLELHLAHGYLLSSFLSPLTNVRRDGYGGSLENRMKFPLEVFEAVRAVWPAEKPMSARISATDWAEGGFTGDDAVVLARALKALGCDIVDVSTGQTVPYARPEFGRMWQTRFADQVRHEAGIPTMAVGAISTSDQVNSILAAGRADLCLLARPHLDDPHWTLHAAREQGYFEQPWPVQYGPAAPLKKA
ncbi:MAG: bifunctional salicylyl-CoA 5-hydroxylase/oxidoreductase [Myxococcales bacterium]